MASGGTSLWTRVLWARAYAARGLGLVAMRSEILRSTFVIYMSSETDELAALIAKSSVRLKIVLFSKRWCINLL